ncbi:aryl-alcohol dehydrogenase [Diaporthe sp. PMI_573]|nr:aryl-alcohol dehydrogenase [Diaporthaceae sp. PMI_573]
MAGPRPQAPKSLLGRHRLLAPAASVHVSPLCLGGMNFGTAWQAQMGECTKETTFDLLNTFYDLGGNFIDTANVYQGGQSEQWIGEWLNKTGRRAEMVISTKYSMNAVMGQPVQASNFGGSGTKAMQTSIRRSLENLQTDYVDIYYIHVYDYATDVPELMQSLNNLVVQGKVLYLGISDTPAWFVVKANAYARQHGLRPFSIYQGRFSAQLRDLERDVIPMCRHEGMAIHAFGVLGAGYFKSPGSEKQEGRNVGGHMRVGREEQLSVVLDKVAKRHGVPITNVALAYALQKAPYIFPIVGGRKVEHLRANIEALSLELSQEDVAEIEKGYEFDIGFPHNHISVTGKVPQGPQDVISVHSLGHFDFVKPQTAIKPHKGDVDGPQ